MPRLLDGPAARRGWWPLLAAGVILLLPWQEAGDQRTLFDLIQVLALASALVMPTLARPPLSGGIGTGWLMAYLAWGALMALRPGYHFAAALEIWAQLVAALWFLALAHTPMPGPLRRRLSGMVVAAAVVQAVWALIEAGGGRAGGTFVNRNFLAAYLNIALAVAIWFALRRGGWARVVAVLSGMVLALTVLATGSRGGLLGLLTVVLLSVPMRQLPLSVRAHPRAFTAGALVLAVLAVLGVWYWAGVRADALDPYRHHRRYIWSAAASVSAGHPWFGVGPGQLKWIAPAHNFPLDNEPFRYGRFWTTAHSMPLQRLVEEGWVGLGLVTAFLICLLRALRARARAAGFPLARAALPAIGSLLVHGCVDVPSDNAAVLLSLAALSGLALAPAVAGAGAEHPARGGRARSLGIRLGVPGLAALVLAGWGMLVAPWMANRAWTQFTNDPDPARAFESLEQAQRWNPYHRDYAYWLGRTMARASGRLTREHLALADGWLGRAGQIEPHDDRAEAERGLLMRRAASEAVFPAEAARRAALRRFEEAARRDPLDPRVRCYAGLVALRLGDFDRARAEAGEAARLEPNFLDAHLLAADASQRAGDRAGAKRALARFHAAQRNLRGYLPRNQYEEDLVRYNAAVLERLQESLK